MYWPCGQSRLNHLSVQAIQPTNLTGGAEGSRTPGLRIANAALCQLSYCPTTRKNTVSSFEFQVARVPKLLSGFVDTVPRCSQRIFKVLEILAATLREVNLATTATVQHHTRFAHQRVHVSRRIC